VEDTHAHIKELIQKRSEVDPENGCWVWTKAKNNGGYGVVTLDRKPLLAHRLSCTVFKGDIHKGMCVMHSCDNPACVNPEHLSVGTYRENSADMVRKGRNRKPAGIDAALKGLSAQQISDIRTDQRARYVIAADYGISPHVVGYLKTNKLP
jgi:hypothetical protein